MTAIAGSRILITGGASGIGRLLALALARRGARVIVWDVNAENLDAVVAELDAAGSGARGYLCDVSRREHVFRVAEEVKADGGPLDVLVNNAGLVTGQSFLELPDAKIEATFGVNTLALFWTAKAFLPDMLARDRGHVVTIASAAGYVGVSRLADYAASKWGAVAFDESLRVELSKRGSRVLTTVICPYYINTGMFDGVRSRWPWLLPILRPEAVAARIVRAIERGQRRVFLPPIVRWLPMARVLPVRMFDGLMNLLGVNDSMDEFRGRDSDRGVQPPRA
jgi:all-trans-retinol dehydrogenase (NAD+)